VAVTVARSARSEARWTPSALIVPVSVDQVTSSSATVAPYWSYPVAVKVVVVPGHDRLRVALGADDHLGEPSVQVRRDLRLGRDRDLADHLGALVDVVGVLHGVRVVEHVADRAVGRAEHLAERVGGVPVGDLGADGPVRHRLVVDEAGHGLPGHGRVVGGPQCGVDVGVGVRVVLPEEPEHDVAEGVTHAAEHPCGVLGVLARGVVGEVDAVQLVDGRGVGAEVVHQERHQR
jgi:hypothetical protein